MSPLLNEDKRALLRFARIAISFLGVGEREYRPEISSLNERLAAPGAAFVTLRRHRRLRGCIGRIAAMEPLAHVVVQCAVSAATEDPRFSPLSPDELSELEIEISVLSAFTAVSPDHVELGCHGLMISRGFSRGVLLPQVAAEYHWTRERFLQETCHKAGLASDAWMHSETQLEVFTAEVFSDADFRAKADSSASIEEKNPADYSNSQ